MNLIEKIQESLHYPPLHKIDPNTEHIKDEHGARAVALLAQATIPAVLTGIYKFSRNEAMAETLLKNDHEDWMEQIFGSRKNEVLENIAAYAFVSEETAETEVEAVIKKTIEILRATDETKMDGTSVKYFLSNERHNILLYLPSQLKIGDLLNDETLDDKTNKMEGPISNLMHGIENLFSNSEQDSSSKK